MDRGDSLNLASPSSTDSEPASATMMKKKKKSKRAVSRRSAIESSGDSSSDDVIARPRPESKPKRTLVSSSSGDGSDPGVSGNPKKHVLLSSSVSSDNLVPSNDIPSTSRGIVHNTPSTSGSSSPIRIARKNLTSVIGSDTSTSSDVLVHPSRRVRHVLSESPSTSSNLQPMSTDDEDEGPRNFVLMNSKKNKLSSTESSGDEDCPSCAICLSSLANRIAAQISGCSHEFHNTCILKWSERTNTCPIDRSKFNKITVRNKQGEIVKVTDIDDTNAATADDDEPAFPDEAVNCMICNHPDNEDVLLLCDGCNRGYHIYCLNPPLARVPEGNWICEHCSPVISLPDSVYFNDALDISIEDYSDNSNPSDMDVSSNDSGEDQPSTSRRRRVGRYRSGSTLTVSVSSRNRNMLQSSRVRHTTITIKQTRKRKRRSTRRSRRRNVQNTVSQRSRIMAAAVAKRSAVACESGGGSVDRKHREKTLRSEPGRPRLSLFSSENFEDYYNPESDGEGEGGGVAVTARTRYPMSRVMDRKAAVARLINTNHRPRVAPRVTIPDSPNTTPSVNVLDDIMGMMEVEKKKSTGTVPIKKDGTFVVPARVDVNSDKNKEKVTETPGYPGGGMPHRPQSRYGSPAGNYQSSPGARHQSGVFSAQGTLPFTPRFSNNFPPGRSVDNFHMFRSPQPRFRSSLPRRFPARRSLPASLLMEPDGEHEDPAQPDEDVDIYGDIGSGPLLPPPQPPATLFAIAPPPEPPVGLLSSPPQPPAGLLSLGSPEEGPSDEEKGLVIDDEEYDPAAPCDSPGAETNAPSLPSDDDSSNSNNLTGISVPDSSANSNDVGAIPVPHAGTKASATSSKNIPPLVNPSNIFSGKLDAFSLLDLSVKPSSTVEAIPIPKPSADNVSGIPIPEPTTVSSGSVNAIPITIQSDSDEEECPNSSLYSSTSLKLARKKSMDKDSSDNSDAEESPVKNNDSAQSVKSGPIRFSIGSKFSAKQKSNLFIDEEEDEDVEDEEKENDHDKERDVEKKKVEEDEAKEKVEGDKGGIVTYESSDEEKEGQENNISKNDVVKTVETEDILSDEEEVKKDQQEAEADDKLSDEEVNKKDEEDILSEEGNDKEGETDKLLENEDDTPPRGKDKADSVDLEDSFEMSPDKARQDEENYLEDEILGSDKAEDNELDKDEVSTQGDILDLNTENLQGVTDVTVHDGTLQDTEDPNKSDSYNGLDGLDVDPVSNSEYGSLSDNADENGEKPEKKKKKKRKITEREEGEIVEPKKKDRKKDKDENNENGLSEKKSKKNKKDKESVEMSPLQEKTVSNNTDNFEQLMSSESIAWKKLSKNTKDRNYREKDELKGRKKKEGRKEIERYNVRKIVGEKALVRKDEFGRDISPQKSKSQSPNFGRSPRKRSLSPRKRSLSPRKRSLSPRKRSLSPRKRSLSPRKRSLSPRKRSRSPRKRSLSRSKSPERRIKKWRSRSRSPDRFRNRSRSVSPRGRKRSPKSKERKPQKNRGRSGSRRRRSRTPRKQRSRSRSKPKKQNRAQLKNKQKIKSKPVETFKSKDGKKKKKKQVRSPSKTKPRSPRGRSPWDFSSTSISRSPSPPPPETYTRSRSWSREKNLTVIVPNMNKKKDKKKAKENRRRKHKDDNSPTLSKEVFTSGDNILVSVNFAHAEKPPPAEPTASKVEKVKAPVKRSKKDIAAMKAAKVREMAAKAKPVAIIDLDVSPFRERTPSPKEVIVLCDSDSENEAPPAKVQDLKAISSGPKTPPEPHIKFAISSKSQTINTIVNPLMDDEDKQGPNTPPEPPSPLPTSPYDPFDPTKSRSPSPTLQSAPSDNLEKAQSENPEKTQLDLLKPSSTPNKDSMQSPAKATSDEVVNLTLSKQEDKQVTSSLATTSQSSVPVYTPAMTTVARGNMNGGEALEDILNLDSDGVYSPGSSLGDDLFDPPKKSPPPSTVNTNKKFDSLFVSKNTSSKTIPYEPKLAKPLPPVGTPKKSAPPKYIPSKAKAKPVTMSKLDEDQLKILDEVPSSAVEMQVKYKYLKKLNRQERVVEEVKHVLKPHYNKKHVTKEQYKDILRKAVPKICHNKSGEINPMKITSLIEAYVKKYRVMNKRRTGGGGGNPANNTTNQHSNMNGAKKKSMWT